MPQQEQQEEVWLNMSECARQVNMSVSKLSRLASLGKIKSKKDRRNERITLVDLNEVKRYLGMS